MEVTTSQKPNEQMSRPPKIRRKKNITMPSPLLEFEPGKSLTAHSLNADTFPLRGFCVLN